MAEALPNRQSLRNGSSSKVRLPHAGPNGHNGSGGPDYLAKESLLLEERARSRREEQGPGEDREPDPGPDREEEPTGELEQLRVENEELRRAVAELRQMVEAAQPPDGRSWQEREKEYESLLEEKSDIIRGLHLKIQELQEKANKPVLPHEEELQALCDELERERAQLEAERKQIEQDRAQLRDDEEELMKQMREMEMAMSRERAEMARQRNELQRLHADVQHALELAARDASLRDRLGPLQRRHQDINTRRGTAPPPEPRQAPPPASPAPAQPPQPKKESGLFRRLFGSSRRNEL